MQTESEHDLHRLCLAFISAIFLDHGLLFLPEFEKFKPLSLDLWTDEQTCLCDVCGLIAGRT